MVCSCILILLTDCMVKLKASLRKLVLCSEGPFRYHYVFNNGLNAPTVSVKVVQLSEKDELHWSKKQLMANMDVAMGGRVAEELVFGADNITGGASSDLEKATKIARAMVTKLGMTDNVSVATTYQQLFLCVGNIIIV